MEIRVDAIAFSPDGQKFASGSFDHDTYIWNVMSGSLLQTFKGNLCISVAFSPDGQKLALGCWDSTVRIMDSESGLVLHKLKAPRCFINSVLA